MDALRRVRAAGDTIFPTGVPALGWFVLALKAGRSLATEEEPFLGTLPSAT